MEIPVTIVFDWRYSVCNNKLHPEPTVRLHWPFNRIPSIDRSIAVIYNFIVNFEKKSSIQSERNGSYTMFRCCFEMWNGRNGADNLINCVESQSTHNRTNTNLYDERKQCCRSMFNVRHHFSSADWNRGADGRERVARIVDRVKFCSKLHARRLYTFAVAFMCVKCECVLYAADSASVFFVLFVYFFLLFVPSIRPCENML